LVESLRDSDSDVRQRAASALGKLGPTAGAAATDLVKLLKDPEVGVRPAAALGRFGAAASAASPDLVELLKDPEVDVRLAAANTLGRLGYATIRPSR
jgi:HEAT repeat protein